MKSPNRRHTTFADIHRVRVQLRSPYRSVIEHFNHDFHFFLAQKKKKGADLRIGLHPAARRPRHWRPLLRTSRSVIYVSGRGSRRIRFFDRAWVNYRFDEGRCDIYCDDETIAYEVCYLVALSYVGESLDRRGVHRIHGLGLSCRGRGTLVLAGSGTGKSTLALEILQKPGMGILSDDTPLIRQDGEMVAFPQRIGLKEAPPAKLRKHVRKFRRVEYGEKFVLGSHYFEQKITAQCPVDQVLLARRAGEQNSSIRPLPRAALAWPLLKWLVVGYETPQVWELFLRFSARDLWWKGWTLYSRSRAAMRLLLVDNVSELKLSEDPVEAGRHFHRWTSQRSAGHS